MQNCAPTYVLTLLGRKWTYRILRHLRQPARFGDIEHYLPTITNHVLSAELHHLQQEELILHQDGRYVLTEAGLALLDAIGYLLQWSSKYKHFAVCPAHQSCADCVRFQEESRRHMMRITP